MAEKKEYRSAIRSRKLIRQAFIELLKVKNFEKITVTDIVSRAEINRSTFYAHYPDIIGVVDEIQEEILEYTQGILREIDFSSCFDNPLPILKKIVKIVEDNHELYSLLSNSSLAQKQLEELKKILIHQTLHTFLVSEREVSSPNYEFMIRFFIGGVIDVYTQWLSGEINCTLNELTEQLAILLSQTLVIYKPEREFEHGKLETENNGNA